jgi:amidase
METLLTRPAVELAGLIRSGEVSSSELVSASLERIEALQPTINAFTYVARDSALESAAQIKQGDDRPFAGVPIAIKDNTPVQGMPLTMCSDLFGDFAPPFDAFLVQRLREAGFILVGKTALPEMGILPTTESRRFGPSRNPWDRDRTPGGSSGGAAAAVASGMVPIAHGNDGGGSIRIPAACCGLVGLKPARGRVSMGPVIGQNFLTVDGVLTRSVADTAHALDVLAGYETGDATWAPPPATPYAQAVAQKPGRLRIALALEPALAGAELDPLYERATRDAAELLKSLGHDVREVSPPWVEMDLLPDFTRTFGPQVSMQTHVGGQIAGREPTEEDVEPLTWELYKHALEVSSIDLQDSMRRLEGAARMAVAFLHEFDALLTPTLAQRPVRIGEINGLGPDPWQTFVRGGYFTPYTAMFNVTGQPGISLPLYQGDDGLPTGIHLVGRPAAEDTLLALAAELEQALPWSDRMPQL